MRAAIIKSSYFYFYKNYEVQFNSMQFTFLFTLESFVTIYYQQSSTLITLRGNQVQNFAILIYLNKLDKFRRDNCPQTLYLEIASIVSLLISIVLGIQCSKELEVIQISQTIQLVFVITNGITLQSCFKYYISDLGIIGGISFYSEIIMLGPLFEGPAINQYASIVSIGLIYYLIRLLTHGNSQVKMDNVLIGLSFAIKFIAVPLISLSISAIFEQPDDIIISLASLILALLLYQSFRLKSLKNFIFITFLSLATQLSNQHHLNLKVPCIIFMLLNEKVNIHRLDYAFLVVHVLLLILGQQRIMLIASYIMIRCLQIVLFEIAYAQCRLIWIKLLLCCGKSYDIPHTEILEPSDVNVDKMKYHTQQ